MVTSKLRPGDRVLIVNDGDGADNSFGTVKTVYKSGRLCVDLDAGGFRNLDPDMVRKYEATA